MGNRAGLLACSIITSVFGIVFFGLSWIWFGSSSQGLFFTFIIVGAVLMILGASMRVCWRTSLYRPDPCAPDPCHAHYEPCHDNSYPAYGAVPPGYVVVPQAPQATIAVYPQTYQQPAATYQQPAYYPPPKTV